MLRGLFFQAWGSLMSLKSQTWDHQLKVPAGGLVLRIFTSWKNPSTSVGFEPTNLGSPEADFVLLLLFSVKCWNRLKYIVYHLLNQWQFCCFSRPRESDDEDSDMSGQECKQRKHNHFSATERECLAFWSIKSINIDFLNPSSTLPLPAKPPTVAI